MALLAAGCAHTSVDSQGNRRIIGFVMLTLPPSIRPADVGGDAIRQQSLGLSITQWPLGTAVSLGWSDTTLAAVRNHSLVPRSALTGGLQPTFGEEK